MTNSGKSVVTSIRLDENLIKESKRQAKKNGYVGYQKMLRQILEMAIYHEVTPKAS